MKAPVPSCVITCLLLKVEAARAMSSPSGPVYSCMPLLTSTRCRGCDPFKKTREPH
jgi:hypothetical protein